MPKKMKKLSILFLILITFAACEKEDEFVKAVIVDESVILSGCGWLVMINSAFYAPQNLPDAYKVGGMEVEIKYDVLAGKLNCQLHQDGLYEIYIKEIR